MRTRTKRSISSNTKERKERTYPTQARPIKHVRHLLVDEGTEGQAVLQAAKMSVNARIRHTLLNMTGSQKEVTFRA